MYCYNLSIFLTLWAICLSFCELEGLRIVSIEFESSFAKQEICGSIWILIFANSVSYKDQRNHMLPIFIFKQSYFPLLQRQIFECQTRCQCHANLIGTGIQSTEESEFTGKFNKKETFFQFLVRRQERVSVGEQNYCQTERYVMLLHVSY